MKRILDIDEILNELNNKGLYRGRKELIYILDRFDVYSSTYLDYKRGREEEDRDYNIKEFYDTQAWVLDRFFPLLTDEGVINIEVLPYKYDEYTYIEVEWEEESDI